MLPDECFPRMLLNNRLTVGWCKRFLVIWKKRIFPSRRHEPHEVAIVEQQYAKHKNQIIQEGVVGSEDDTYLQNRRNPEEDDAEAAGQKKHPHQNQFYRQGGKSGADV